MDLSSSCSSSIHVNAHVNMSTWRMFLQGPFSFASPCHEESDEYDRNRRPSPIIKIIIFTSKIEWLSRRRMMQKCENEIPQMHAGSASQRYFRAAFQWCRRPREREMENAPQPTAMCEWYSREKHISCEWNAPTDTHRLNSVIQYSDGPRRQTWPPRWDRLCQNGALGTCHRRGSYLVRQPSCMPITLVPSLAWRIHKQGWQTRQWENEQEAIIYDPAPLQRQRTKLQWGWLRGVLKPSPLASFNVCWMHQVLKLNDYYDWLVNCSISNNCSSLEGKPVFDIT